MSSICSESLEDFYTDGNFDVGKILYTDINLTIPLTGYDFFARHSNGKIFSLDPNTGEVLSFTGGICDSGTAGLYRLSSNANIICGQPLQTLYTDGDFQVGSILYSDINLEEIVTGYDYVADANGNIYTLSSTTGEVLEVQTDVCLPSAIGTYILANDLSSVCNGNYSYLFTLNGNEVGAFLYLDSELMNVVTGYKYFTDVLTKSIFELNSSTGEIVSKLGIDCNSQVVSSTASSDIAATIVYNYNFIGTASRIEMAKVVQMLIIDTRKGASYEAKNGNAIKVFIEAAIDEIDADSLFYKVESKQGNLAGYFTLLLSNDGKTAALKTIKLRNNFVLDYATIGDQINQFIISNKWKSDIL